MNNEVTKFLDGLEHPFRKEIEQLRLLILSSCEELKENIKWNGPNYGIGNEDRITMRIQPPKQLQLIFHRGVKVQEKLKEKLIKEDFGLLVWKENDRAVATFKSMEVIEDKVSELSKIVVAWVDATRVR